MTTMQQALLNANLVTEERVRKEEDRQRKQDQKNYKARKAPAPTKKVVASREDLN